MSEDKAISSPLWATVVGALVAAIMVVAAFFLFVQGGEAKQVANEQPPYGPKIIDGTGVYNGKYAFIVALLDKRLRGGAFDEQFCGGTLIDKDSVLTAAHCFFDPETGDPDPESLKVLRVIVGRTVLNSNQGQVRNVKRVFIHPDYKFPNYDAAVVKLSRPVSGITPIKLASSKQNYLEKPGRKATVAGWGSTTAVRACLPTLASPVYANRMRHAQVPIVSDSRADQLAQDFCRFRQFRAPYTPRLMVAAGGTGKDACQGDSGGPLFVARASDGNSDNGASSAEYTQIGITSFGFAGCGAQGIPGVYTEVNASPISSFIKRAASQ
jgi:secreted trypsin-like serine protease